MVIVAGLDTSNLCMISIACAAVVLLAIVGPGSVSTYENVPPTTTTTVAEQLDEESGIIWKRIDDHTIEVSLPNKKTKNSY